MRFLCQNTVTFFVTLKIVREIYILILQKIILIAFQNYYTSPTIKIPFWKICWIYYNLILYKIIVTRPVLIWQKDYCLLQQILKKASTCKIVQTLWLIQACSVKGTIQMWSQSLVWCDVICVRCEFIFNRKRRFRSFRWRSW